MNKDFKTVGLGKGKMDQGNYSKKKPAAKSKTKVKNEKY